MKVIPVRWLDKDRICSCHRGAECPSPGKHPMHDDWPGVSSDDPAVVGHWWRAEPQIPATQWYPFSNVGVVTGRRSGIFVLDEDTYAGGSQTLGAYERRHGPMPVTRVHQTGRGGTHYVFEHPGFEVRNSAKRVLGTGLDVRGENGFVLVPPSVNEGGPYDLNPAHDITPAPAPDWLLALLRNHDKEQAGETLSAEPPVAPNGQTRAYAERALESECLTMRSAESGSRNETLNNCAFSLGQLGGAGILSEDAAFAGLRDAAMAAGLTEGEIRGTFISGWRAGMNRPRNVQWGIMQASWPCRPRTEFGLADRMADHWGDRMRWCPELGTWMTYLGGVWMPATKQEGLWAAQIMIRNLLDTEGRSYETEPEVALDGEMMPSPYDRFTDWVAKQHTRKAVSVAADLATGLPLMRMSQSTFDGNPLVINARNGVVDLCTGELSPHDPEQRMTLQAAASYYPGEPATRWQEFLKQVQPDPAMRAYLQRVAGYCATGQTSEQAAFLLHGTGANGKSVFISVLAHVLGTYAQTMPVETLMASSVDGRIPNDVARMAGKRFLQASETKAGKSLDEQRLKQLTGGDTISARFMRGEYFDFRPVGKILLTTNHLPRMSDDSATWRRIQLITWPVIIPEDQRDGYLQDTLIRDEADGILAWIVEGALAWQRDGLNPPQPVLDALRRYQEEEDTVGQFIDDCLVIKDDDPQRGAIGRAAHEIYAVYVAWCKQNGHTPTAQRGLSTRLKKKGHEPYRGGGWNGFPTLAVRTTFGEVNTEAPG
jgi:putative DNA primase/helicase